MTDTSLSDLTGALLSAARAAGAEAADAVALHGISLSIGVRRAALEQAERSEGTEIGLRVIQGRRQACVSASDTKPATLREMAERAVAMAGEAPEDPTCGLADPAQLAGAWDVAALDLLDPEPEPAPDVLQAAALTAEAAALAHDGIAQVESASAGFGRRAIHLASSAGFSGGYARTSHGLSCVAITGEGTGMERSSFGDMRLHRADLLPPDQIGRIAALRTLERANPRQPETGRFPVLFDERIAAGLIGHLLGAVNGTAIARGASWLLDGMETAVLPDGIDLIEDPLRPRAAGSRPFDGEGLATGRRAIVENGILRGWTLDLATGRKLGLPSTANAMRGASAPPSPGNHNIALTQGTASPADLMREMGCGVLVTSLFKPTINPTTGDYSAGGGGIWIEGGEKTHAISEFTIAGNLRTMLRSIRPANDARGHLAHVVPSILVPEMTVAGR
ncbi:MAG: TldD/PmbA family protein [Qingshengfaniella sp.]